MTAYLTSAISGNRGFRPQKHITHTLQHGRLCKLSNFTLMTQNCTVHPLGSSHRPPAPSHKHGKPTQDKYYEPCTCLGSQRVRSIAKLNVDICRRTRIRPVKLCSRTPEGSSSSSRLKNVFVLAPQLSARCTHPRGIHDYLIIPAKPSA